MSEFNEYTAQPRKRGRPSKADLEARKAREEAAQRAQAVSAAPVEQEPAPPEPKRIAETQERRRRRRDDGPMARLKLTVPEEMKEEGFEYRWSNDDGRKIHDRTVGDDWDVVRTKAIDGDGEGTPVTRIVGKHANGEPLKAYLTRKPKDWYDEDKAKEQEEITEMEKQIRRDVPTVSGGLSAKDHSYIPDRHDGYSSDKSGRNRVG